MAPIPPPPDPSILIISTLASLAFLIIALRSLHHKRLIDDTPTLKTIAVFIGLAELKGTAETTNPLTSYLTETRCVYYNWRIEEHWSRQVTETYHDADGKTKTRARTESGWKQVASGEEAPKFYLQDETGIIQINPHHADITGHVIINKIINRQNPLYYDKGPRHSIPHSRHQRRLTETIIPLHAPIYIIGQAHERNDIIAAEIAHDPEEPFYVISTNGEKSVTTGYANKYLIISIIGLLVSTIPLLFSETLNQLIIFAPLIFYLTALPLGWIIVAYNSLITLRNSVEQALSQIDIQLNRRSDLIPRLVEIIQTYQTHEQTIQTKIAELRIQINTTNEAKAITPILTALTENYPDLKAGNQYQKLQHSLEETEQRIAHARDYYNQITNFYNTRLETIPDKYLATLAGLKQRKLWSGTDFNRAKEEIELIK
jgi:hypothetical protein